MKRLNKISRYLRPETLLICMVFFLFIIDLVRVLDGSPGGYHDSSFYIHPALWPRFGAVALLVMAAVYRFTRRYRQWPALQYFHVGSYLAIPLIIWLGDRLMDVPYPGNPVVFYYSPATEMWIGILTIILVMGQLAFVVNVVAGFMRGRKNFQNI
ncbi:hypothetical protein [Chitinophaga caseinilytica]|uniref:hypothetical protein n=1 Tax=Chitinophaga caseinilytica TaxID=2267521 RepID=UPI003C30A917